jgi:hypothetical protein
MTYFLKKTMSCDLFLKTQSYRPLKKLFFKIKFFNESACVIWLTFWGIRRDRQTQLLPAVNIVPKLMAGMG